MPSLVMDSQKNVEENRSNESEESDQDLNEINFEGSSEASKLCEKIIDDDSYILHLAATRATHPLIALATSHNKVQIFKLEDDMFHSRNVEFSGEIVELKFNKENDNLLWIASYNGTVCLWDLRTPEKPVSSFTDTTLSIDDGRKFNCFDISSNGRLLCSGTEAYEGDSFLLFWDVRKCSLLGGFWESHTDDITQVKFHENDSTKLISGATDGLINLYDLNESCEDDALKDSLNTECSIEKLNWFTQIATEETVSCVTHTADVQFWKSEDAQPYCNFRRGDICHQMRRKSENYTYIVNVHKTQTHSLILAGSNANHGECVRGLKLENTSLKPYFELSDNNQRLRCSWFNENSGLLLTGGEGGCLNAWKL